MEWNHRGTEDTEDFLFSLRRICRSLGLMAMVVMPMQLHATSSGSATSSSLSWDFHSSISQVVLENYLSRAIQCTGMCGDSAGEGSPHFEDDLRMLRNIGAKFVGRAAIAWNLGASDEEHFQLVKQRAARVHQVDPEIVLQACIFEIVHRGSPKDSKAGFGVDRIAIPAWVFQEFELPVMNRTFDYDAMLSRDGRGHDQWDKGASVPDITRPETQMWFYYRARR